ncbi:MAG TPA: type IX secretion system membrane protein PorP/SprF, partial [Saprospiraceae bacterium]|nr:type IX secretion system membrane protein PorP/SprF [Saprospiraceae bacterium]
MSNATRVLLSCLLLTAFARSAYGQQDPMFTKYFFNSLTFNPAYAGSRDVISGCAIYRQQWSGLEGAPVSQSLSVHSPLRNPRGAVGLSMVNDKAGATGTTTLNGAFAYRLPLGDEVKLATALQAGVGNWRGDWTKLTLEDPSDVAFRSNLNRWLPNFGAGIYLSAPRFYAGFGVPSILEYDLRRAAGHSDGLFSKNYRHYYTTVGAAFPLGSESVMLRPSALLKTTGLFSSFRSDAAFRSIGSPTELDVDVSVFFFETFWVGAAFRTALELRESSTDSADLWAAWHLRNGMRIGAAYDLPLSPIRKTNAGSFELMLGYDFETKVR